MELEMKGGDKPSKCISLFVPAEFQKDNIYAAPTSDQEVKNRANKNQRQVSKSKTKDKEKVPTSSWNWITKQSDTLGV
ncbi:hypothetical protein GN244_ATG15598 [Phytophthora infestans]|uniref:Uncharacterized protein n=1 Tax=Phytophthora infestans TaxID=4787 RepID=A0A833SSH4_PHYIN|nr:hypothetical protein GN244_ATG15598 [Phytophthora infestans]